MKQSVSIIMLLIFGITSANSAMNQVEMDSTAIDNLASGSYYCTSGNRCVMIWVQQTDVPIKTFHTEEPISLAACSSNGTLVALVCYHTILVLEIQKEKLAYAMIDEKDIHSIWFSQNNKLLMVEYRSPKPLDPIINVWKAQTGKLINTLMRGTIAVSNT